MTCAESAQEVENDRVNIDKAQREAQLVVQMVNKICIEMNKHQRQGGESAARAYALTQGVVDEDGLVLHRPGQGDIYFVWDCDDDGPGPAPLYTNVKGNGFWSWIPAPMWWDDPVQSPHTAMEAFYPRLRG